MGRRGTPLRSLPKLLEGEKRVAVWDSIPELTAAQGDVEPRRLRPTGVDCGRCRPDGKVVSVRFSSKVGMLG